MSNDVIRVLLVEDNPGDVRLLRSMLKTSASNSFSVTHTDRIEEARRLLGEQEFDVVVLDLGLPDSKGMETVDQTKRSETERNVPVVVVTGVHEENEGLMAVQHGAQDYLIKDNLRSEILVRALRYAVERQRLLDNLEEERATRRQAAEIESLEKIASPGTSLVTARAYGQERLRESSGDTFQLFVEQYGELIERALETRAFKVDRGISQSLRVLSQRLGFLRASPRDVVEIHMTAIKATVKDSKRRRAHVVVEEARMLLIESLGYLAAYYRDHMVPTVRRRPADQPRLED